MAQQTGNYNQNVMQNYSYYNNNQYVYIDQDEFIRDIRSNKVIGITLQREQEYAQEIQELKELVENYYDKLVKNGVISVPKTAEEIAQDTAQQQQQFMSLVMETMQGMQNEIKELRANGLSDNDIRISEPEVGLNSEKDQSKTRGSTKSNTARKTTVSGKSE